jgi:hypothetical protein
MPTTYLAFETAQELIGLQACVFVLMWQGWQVTEVSVKTFNLYLSTLPAQFKLSWSCRIHCQTLLIHIICYLLQNSREGGFKAAIILHLFATYYIYLFPFWQ